MARIVEGFTVLPAHSCIYQRTELTTPAFAFPAKAGPQLLTPFLSFPLVVNLLHYSGPIEVATTLHYTTKYIGNFSECYCNCL